MNEMIFCQSCGMPMESKEQFGTNKDGGQNEDYCVYCFQNGAFTADISMNEMIDFCASNVGEWGMEITKEQAIEQMKAHFPTLKRWR